MSIPLGAGMSNFEMAAIVLGMTLVTLLTRNLLMLTGPYWTPSNSRLSSLRYAPAAGLAALVIPDIIQALQDAAGAGSVVVGSVVAGSEVKRDGWIRLAAVVTTVLTYYFTRRSGVTLLAGTAVFLLVHL